MHLFAEINFGETKEELFLYSHSKGTGGTWSIERLTEWIHTYYINTFVSEHHVHAHKNFIVCQFIMIT